MEIVYDENGQIADISIYIDGEWIEDEDWPMTYLIKDRNGQDYEIKDIERLAKPMKTVRIV